MPDVRHLIRIEASPGAVLTLVSSARGLSSWWTADVTEPEANVFQLGFFGRAPVLRLRYLEGTVGRVAYLCESGGEWRGTQLWFELTTRESPGRGGESAVELALTHSDWEAETEAFRSADSTWGDLLVRLERVAEGKASGPLFQADRPPG